MFAEFSLLPVIPGQLQRSVKSTHAPNCVWSRSIDRLARTHLANLGHLQCLFIAIDLTGGFPPARFWFVFFFFLLPMLDGRQLTDRCGRCSAIGPAAALAAPKCRR